MVKYDSSEKQLWNKSFGGSSNDVFKSIIETKNGEIIVSGNTDEIKGNDTLEEIFLDLYENKEDNHE